MKQKTKRTCMRLTAFLLMFLMVVGLAGCSSKSAAPAESGQTAPAEQTSSAAESTESTGESAPAAAQEEGTSSIAASVTVSTSDPSTFTPLRPAGGEGKCVLNEIFEPLCDTDGPGGDLYGVLAKDWYFEGNDLHVEIYDYIYDTAGNHITAEDVVFSFEKPYEEGFSFYNFMTYTDGIEQVSEYEVVFHWKEECMDTFEGMENMLRNQGIFSKAAYESSADEMATTPVGTGPYVLSAYTTGVSCSLERNENYWQKDESLIGPQHQANVQTINYLFISESAQIINALKTGTLDYAKSIPSTALDDFNSSSDWTVVGAPSLTFIGARFNCLEGTPFGDINMRAALCYAINSDDIIEAVGGEAFAQKLYESCLSSVKYYNSDCETWDTYYTTYDLELAKDYLAKASGYENHTFEIYYSTVEYEEMEEAIALMIGYALEQLGLSYNLHPTTDINNVNVPVNGDWDIILMSAGSNGSAIRLYTKVDETNDNNPELTRLYNIVNSASGASEDSVREINKYLIENFYSYGVLEPITYNTWRSSVIVDASKATYRGWIIPGAWTYTK